MAEPGETPEEEAEDGGQAVDRDEAVGQKVAALRGTSLDFASVIANQNAFQKIITEYAAIGETARRAIIESMGLNLRPSALETLVANMRLMDQVGKGLTQPHFQLAARLAELKYEFGAVHGWRVAIESQSAISKFVKAQQAQSEAFQSALRQLSAVSRGQVHFTDWIVQRDAATKLLTEDSSRPLSAWRDYVTRLPQDPSVEQLKISTSSGHSSAGLLGADALISGLEEGEDEETILEITDRVESDVLEPWEAGRLRASADLRKTLGSIHPRVPDFLDGAWDLLLGKNPVSAELMAGCVVEAVDQVLREAAPEARVVEWLPKSGRPSSEWYSDRGSLTRGMRVRYIAHRAGADLKLVLPLADSLVAASSRFMKQAQGMKHGSKPADIVKARALLVTAEGFLTTLFVAT